MQARASTAVALMVTNGGPRMYLRETAMSLWSNAARSVNQSAPASSQLLAPIGGIVEFY
jgi:hypothetical protein